MTYLERAALAELALRPAFALHGGAGAEVTTEIAIAGQTGILPLALCSQVAALTADAIPEAAGDLRRSEEHRAAWRAGDASHGIPGLGHDATEGCFTDSIQRDTRLLEGLRSLDRRLPG